MSRILRALCCVAPLLAAPLLALPVSGSPLPGHPAPTPVLVVGTIHNNHAANPNYSYEHIVQILARFHPDVVCVEIRPADFRKVAYLTEMMVATTYAFERGLKVYPIDWWDDKVPAREERAAYEKTSEYATKSAREKQLIAESAVAKRFIAAYGEDERRQMQDRGLEFFNGADYNGYVAETYRISMAVYGDHAMNLYYETRNRNMSDLIGKAIAENPGKKIVVLSGAEHKHYFDRSLASIPGVEVVRFESLLPLKPVEMGPAVTKLLRHGTATLYFDLSTPEGEYACYDGALVTLMHGMGMDLYPEKIPAANVDSAKEIIDEWAARKGPATRLRSELGWYHFLKGATRDALADFEAVVPHLADIQPERMRAVVFRNLGYCYDLTGEREKAIAAYEKGEQIATQIGFPAEAIRLLFAEYKTKPYAGFQQK